MLKMYGLDIMKLIGHSDCFCRLIGQLLLLLLLQQLYLFILLKLQLEHELF